MSYNTFRPSNSQLVPAYAGNTLKEYEGLLKQSQDNYNLADELMQGMGVGVNSMVSNPQDREALKGLYNKYSGVLKGFADRGDLHNILPMITKAARKFATEYKPFADAYAQRNAYITSLRKELDDGKIDESQYALGLQASDSAYKGLSRDEITGQWRGQYAGMAVVGRPDMNEFVNKALQNAAASSNAVAKINDKGEHMFVSKSGTEILSADRVAAIVGAAFKNDPNVRKYLQNYSALIGAARDYSAYDKMDPTKVLAREAKVDKDGKVVKDKKGNTVYRDLTLQELKQRGVDLPSYMHAQDVNAHQQELYRGALEYAVAKYPYSKSTYDISNVKWNGDADNGDGTGSGKRKPNFDTPINTLRTLNTPGKPEGYKPSEWDGMVTEAIQTATNLANDFNKKYANRKKVGNRWFVGDTDVTEQFRQDFANQHAQKIEADRLANIRKRAIDESGIKMSHAEQQEVERLARQRAAQGTQTVDLPEGSYTYSPGYEKEYENIMQQKYGDKFKVYKQKIAQYTKSVPMIVPAWAPTDKESIESVETFLNNAVGEGLSNQMALLTPKNTRDGMQSRQLDAKEWDKTFKGRVNFSQLVLTANPNFPIGIEVRTKSKITNNGEKKYGEDSIIGFDLNLMEQFNFSPQVKQQMREIADFVAAINKVGNTINYKGIDFERTSNGAIKWSIPNSKGGQAHAGEGSTIFEALNEAVTSVQNARQ